MIFNEIAIFDEAKSEVFKFKYPKTPYKEKPFI